MAPIEWHRHLICGDRDWAEPRPIIRLLKRLKARHTGNYQDNHHDLIIIEGEAPGADLLARIHAEALNIHVARVAALWGTRHRGAGPQRNEAMLGLAPEHVWAFHPDLRYSRGTLACLVSAAKLGIPFTVFPDQILPIKLQKEL